MSAATDTMVTITTTPADTHECNKVPKLPPNGRQSLATSGGKHRLTATSGSPAKTSLRIRSASVGRSRDVELRCRYWAFLFDNLNRAVDEIYQNCESDESVVECKETLMVLDNYRREFTALIEWLNLKSDYESTPQRDRPSSLAWEVRTSMTSNQMIYWNRFFGRNSEVTTNSVNTSPQKSLNTTNKTKDQMNGGEEKENNSPEPVVNKDTNGSVADNNVKPVAPSVRRIAEESDAKPIVSPKATIKSSVSTPTLNTVTTSSTSKPLNPLAQTFKSRLHPMAPTSTTAPAPKAVSTAAPAAQQKPILIVPTTAATAAPTVKKSTSQTIVSENKSAPKPVSTQQTTALKTSSAPITTTN
ncbi:unnamed protein product, partial [Oppiella nova]